MKFLINMNIRLLAATIGPLANVTSIAALVTYWRQDLIDLAGEVLSPLQGIPIRDPKWYFKKAGKPSYLYILFC